MRSLVGHGLRFSVPWLDIAAFLVNLLEVLVGHGCGQRILPPVHWDGELPSKKASMAPGLQPLWPVAKRMLINPVRLIVNHRPAILARDVSEPVIEEWKSVAELTMPIRERLLGFLLTPVDVRIEEHVARGDAKSQAHSGRRDEPIIVGRHVVAPCSNAFLEEVICQSGICLKFEEHSVTLTEGEG